ncbi:HNH endonuclease [Enterococcus dispar]|uniref:HNH endonuclease n=1 Tax=Enterococcus dispar TaxID=44009 RepID=UPI0005596AF6|nr:HNH endonuclease signature motif containing protein [Enterococcus dispar]
MDKQYYQWLVELIHEDRLKVFYDSAKWRHLRQRAMKRDHYECQMCKALGRHHKVENVHHIKEVKDRPDLALTLDNLICLCIDHHNEVHERYMTIAEKKQKKLNSFKNFDPTERW